MISISCSVLLAQGGQILIFHRTYYYHEDVSTQQTDRAEKEEEAMIDVLRKHRERNQKKERCT